MSPSSRKSKRISRHMKTLYRNIIKEHNPPDISPCPISRLLKSPPGIHCEKFWWNFDGTHPQNPATRHSVPDIKTARKPIKSRFLAISFHRSDVIRTRGLCLPNINRENLWYLIFGGNALKWCISAKVFPVMFYRTLTVLRK